MNILDAKNINTAIRRAKKKLIARAKDSGVYEDFGQAEVMVIRDMFITLGDYTIETNRDRDKLKEFHNWCSNYTGRYKR